MGNDKKHQFTHSNTRRRASVVYGSDGKGGIFVPSDFITAGPDDGAEDESIIRRDEESAVGFSETEPLLAPNGRKFSKHRKSSVARELIEEERELLKSHNINVGADEDEVIDAFENAVINKQLEETTWQIELVSLFKASIPLVVTFLLQMSLSTVSVFTVGHLGATELAAVSMGSMTANITGYATIQGISTALDTLCPQAFGAKKYTLVGAYIQKCIALIVVVMLPILVIWVFFGYGLICLIVPDKETAKLAAVYLKYIAPGIPAYIAFECGKRFLQAQGIFHISTYVLLIAAPSNLVMNIFLVNRIGYLGAPIAVAINYWIMALGLIVSIVFFIDKDQTPSGIHPLSCWGGLNVRQAFTGWKKLASLALPGLVMLEAEFLAFEILTLMASYLGTVALAAQSIGTTMAALAYQVPFAIGIASSTRIANFLGAGLVSAARTSTKVSISFGLVISILNFLVLFCFQTQIAQAFTKDEDVIRTVGGVMWLIAIMQISDSMNANSAGCLRGQGQTKIGGIVNFVSYYMLGIPLSIYITFYSRFGGTLHGLWFGSFVALTVIGVVQSYYALCADFEQLCENAKKNTTVEHHY
ncbi:ethionine resistance protein [Suhomyces tanzawaensis NRRL Y-17324]|uniref:Ethionine resistance protein n=1 Tax=Suhomyces tanzawaensis NRRL Y-17324 TaxID=984487 RepID=A0A1E4SE41_9ASCO|nr:ethionine resistance protein [Suhomyces tanzawaensis NRRL Y-17324]ODV77791.1 ethionine resistance protein [Suhomyces tanzawaensis NRRL Y-17324]